MQATRTETPVVARSAASSTPRVDLYAPIHKALRLFMTDTLVRIGRMDLADSTETTLTLAQLRDLLELCESHVDHENHFVHTAMEARQPGGARRTGDDHVGHLASIDELRDEVTCFEAAPADQKASLALRLYRHLALFVAENFQHMHVEETQNNAVLWAHYSDAELMDLHHRLVASITPQENLLVARWMIPALDPAAAAMVLNGAKASMPPEAFLGVVEHIRPHVRHAVWAKLAPAIGVAQQPGLVNHR
jgi:hypothetical protein